MGKAYLDILREIAKYDPLEFNFGKKCCFYCRAIMDWGDYVEKHDPDCLYRRALSLVEVEDEREWIDQPTGPGFWWFLGDHTPGSVFFIKVYDPIDPVNGGFMAFTGTKFITTDTLQGQWYGPIQAPELPGKEETK